VTSTCTPSKGRTERDGTRRQAASLRPAKRHGVDSRITLKAVRRGKPTVSSGRKAAVLGARRPARGTPPGSKSGACMQRGSSGTWERHVSPCHTPGVGDRGTQRPGVGWGRRPDHEPVRDTTNAQKPARYRGASAERSDPRRAGWPSERRIVPGKVGNGGPKDPREGRRRRASRCTGEPDGRDRESTNRPTNTAAPCGPGGPRLSAGIHDPGLPARGGRSAGGIPSHEHVQCPGN
jgi:hypothetical protein